jgi:hypothetical protein
MGSSLHRCIRCVQCVKCVAMQAGQVGCNRATMQRNMGWFANEDSMLLAGKATLPRFAKTRWGPGCWRFGKPRVISGPKIKSQRRFGLQRALPVGPRKWQRATGRRFLWPRRLAPLWFLVGLCVRGKRNAINKETSTSQPSLSTASLGRSMIWPTRRRATPVSRAAWATAWTRR